MAAIDTLKRVDSEVAWLSTVARRRQVDRVRRRAREQRVAAARPADSDPTSVGPEETVVDRAHASWLAASLTQLPPTTREVVDLIGGGRAPREVARSMNLSPRSVESHLTRARRHLRRLGALGVPLGALLGWVLRRQPGSRTTPSAMAVAVPVLATVVAVLPSSVPLEDAPAAPLPAPAPVPGELIVPVAPAPSPAELPPDTARGVPGGSTGPAPEATAGTSPAGPVDPSAPAPEGTPSAGGDQPVTEPSGPGDPAEQPTPLNRGCGLPGELLGPLGCVVDDVADAPRLPVDR